MSNQNASVLVRIEKNIVGDRGDAIKQEFASESGVVAVENSTKLPNLFLIRYDAIKMPLSKLINKIRKQDENAYLVGM